MLEKLHQTTVKNGLLISYEKTQVNNVAIDWHTKYGVVKKVNKLNHLGEWIQRNGLDNEANKTQEQNT